MFSKPHAEFLYKNLFSCLIAASLAIHALIIFLSPQAGQIISLRSLRDSFVREPDDCLVALELENTGSQQENPSAVQESEDERKKEEEKKAEEEKKEEKKFTDTEDNPEDEESAADTDKIGEKGSVAKDFFPNDKSPVNNEPHAEGRTSAPLLGKGGAPVPGDGRQPSQAQDAVVQAPVAGEGAGDKNIPPRFANLPKGFEKVESPPNTSRQPQPQAPFQKKERALDGEKKEALEGDKSDKHDAVTKAESIQKKPKRERLTLGRGVEQKDVEPVSFRDGALFTDRQDDETVESETEEESPSVAPQERELAKKEEIKEDKPGETKEAKKPKEVRNPVSAKPEPHSPPMEPQGVEPQRMLDRGLDEQESAGESPKTKVSINVNAKSEGAKNDPVLFEDTISNAAIPGAPSFNVKKHEYASYFKHIRDRISLYWFLGYGTRAEIKLETRDDKPIVVEFKVMPDGSIEGIRIVDDAGNFQLASRLMASIKSASPLSPFPPNIKEPSVDVRFNFYFF